jgi:hypothetical protein
MNLPEKIAAIIGLTQIFKFFGTPSSVLPIISIIMGAMTGYLDDSSITGILRGFFLGAVCTGIFGIVKNAAETIICRTKKSPYSELEADDDRGV